MTVLIMAGGDGTRWTRPTPKQLTELPGGETVIGRVIRQVRWFNPKQRYQHPTIITHRPDIYHPLYKQYGVYWSTTVVGSTLVETLRRYIIDPYTKADYYTVLLGDTVYSKATMNAILTCDKPLAFFADVGDIYAVCFHRDSIPTLLAACETIVDKAERGAFGDLPAGKLWHLYRQIAGYPLITHNPNFDDGLLVRVHDWTCDLDSEDHWNWFQANVLDAGLLDDVAEGVGE